MMHSSRNQISRFFRTTKMKVALVIFAVLACGLALPKYQANEQNHGIKQQHVYDVLKYINNPLYHKEFLQIAQSFDVKSNAEHYKNEAYENFLEFYNHDGFLNKGEIFSIFNHEHMQQAKALVKLFYYADSYQIFHYTALWARHHLNEGLFLYSYSVAVAHRPDTQDLVLPPIYELYPHFFFNSEVLQKAYQLKMAHYDQGKQQSHFTIHANYSGFYLNLDPEQSLSYYLEDVGLNAFYFYYNVYFPYWMRSDEFHLNQKRGELFYFIHKQLYARYHLERLSHGLGDVEFFNWDLPFKTGYYPSLTYPNGLSFPERPHFANLKEYLHYYGQRLCDRSQSALDYTYVQTYEQRIREAIDSGFVQDHDGNKHQLYSEEGINILGNIIEGNADSPNHQYYGSFVNIARHLLGYSKHPLNHHKLAPSALEHYSTSMRDPAFYQIFKKVFLLIDQFKQNLPHYHQKHLYQTGLKIENVEFDRLVTYYDHFYSDITNGLFVTPEEYERDSFKVKVHQYRLNHKNFNYKVHVKADKATKAAVRVFIGPKYDEHGRTMKLSEIHDKIFQIDHFAHDLKAGDNVITRNSADSQWFIGDLPSFFERYHGVAKDEHSGSQTGWPLRFKLPRGREEGLSFQVYVIVYPYVPSQKVEQQHGLEGLENDIQGDSFPLGYPFDRPTAHEDVYEVPNAYVKDVKIYHQVNKDILHGNDFSIEHGDQDDDVMVFQRGDHNNYNRYHYQVGHDDDQQKDEVDDVKTKHYQTYGFRSFFHDLTKKYPGLFTTQVYAPGYKNYQESKYQGVKTGKYDDDQYYGDSKLQYKKQDGLGEDHGYDYYKKHDDDKYYGKYQEGSFTTDDYQDKSKYPSHFAFGNDEQYGKYQKHGVYGDIEDNEYPQKYGYGDDKFYGKYPNTWAYGRTYGTKYTPHQVEDQVKYGYGDNYKTAKYQYGSVEHHEPLYHHY